MFEDIFQGIMCILFGIGMFAFGIVTTRQKIGNYDFYEGEVTSVNSETRDIIVSYKVGEDFYSTSYHMHDLADMPEVNLQQFHYRQSRKNNNRKHFFAVIAENIDHWFSAYGYY